jgi:hypothetical protein
MLAAITAALGIIATLCAWFLNPKRRLYAELEQIYKDLEVLYAKRDKALANNDSDTLTVVTADIIKLCARKTRILQQLGQDSKRAGTGTTPNP